MSDPQGVTSDDLDECWCCDGLHDSLGKLCPDCDDAGCKHFGGECQSDHKPVLPDGGRPGVEVLQGEYDDSHWHVENTPQPGFVIEEVGDNSTHWTYDWQEMGEPAPRDFERVSMLEVKLVVAMTDWDDEVLEAANEAHEAIVDLKRAMADARDLDEEARQDIMMGNLDALPEVKRFDPQEDSQP